VAFGDESVRIKTLLGSCVAVTFWHPERRIGAMCHYLLPQRPRPGTGLLDAKYGEDAIAMITETFLQRGLRSSAFEVQMFGGANMFGNLPSGMVPDIGGRNASEGHRILLKAGFQILREDLAGEDPRVILFDIRTGEVSVAQRGHGSGGAAGSQGSELDRRSR
jgi:chemotaxis protein CheD